MSKSNNSNNYRELLLGVTTKDYEKSLDNIQPIKTNNNIDNNLLANNKKEYPSQIIPNSGQYKSLSSSPNDPNKWTIFHK
jgi:hypothetical protein